MDFLNYLGKTALTISEGFSVTLGLFLFTIILSLPLGLLLALGAISKHKWLNEIVGVYIWVLRGTPLLLQILFVYFGIPAIVANIGLSDSTVTAFQNIFNNFNSAVIAFVLNYAAYFAEIFRAGIQSIDKGQYEGAKALGYTRGQTMRLIIFPQMIRRVLPPVSNETITLVKDTSLVSIIALSDIMHATKVIVMREANVAAFGVAAIFYLVMTLILTYVFKFLEKKFTIVES